MTAKGLRVAKLADAAAWYGANGIPVFPLAPKRKTPATAHGFKDATTDPATIAQWWEQNPEANIGVPTGAVSGLDVLDGDPRNGGPATREELVERLGPLPEMPEAITGGGGRHFYFRHIPGLGALTLPPGIDVKADGGYIVLPPSIHPDTGKRYEWDGAAGAKGILTPPELPAALFARRNGHGADAKPGRKIPEGRRNATLASLAGTMRRKGFTEAAIQVALLEENRTRCEPSLLEDEVKAIASSVGRYEPADKPPETEQNRGGRKTKAAPVIISVDDLMLMDLPAPQMSIERVLSRAGATVISGPHKSCKTITAVQMLFAGAANTPLFDYFRIEDPGPGLIIQKDDPAGAASLKQMLERTKIPMKGKPVHMLFDVPFNLGLEFFGWLREQIRAYGFRRVVLDSYTSLRGVRSGSVDIVKAEAWEFSELDRIGKDTDSAISIIHHNSRSGVGRDWSEQAAGSFAVTAATEGQISITRFPTLPIDAPERLVQVRGRHLAGLEMVLRFRLETLDMEFVLEGPGSALYPEVLDLRSHFGSMAFTPKQVTLELGMPHRTVYRFLGRLCASGLVRKLGRGEYLLTGKL